VDGRKGDDANDGASPDQAFRTIQKACDGVSPGDEVLVAPGVYFENVRLKCAGAAGKPIVFRADRRGKAPAVITGADPSIRRGEVAWKLEDQGLGLWSAPLAAEPSRALYGGADLYPYASVEALKRFVTTGSNPGPKHGFAWDPAGRRVYVRLHASGKYGPQDPSRHAMAFSPTSSAASHGGTRVEKPSDYNFGILVKGDAHVVVDGFTFETPGIAGVYSEGNRVVVRNCRFLGCKAGVAGLPEDPDRSKMTGEVTVEFCEYTQHPAFEDMAEALREAVPGAKEGGEPRFFWWARKGSLGRNWGLHSSNTYEVGLVSFAGRNWTVRNNHIHDVFEALSYLGCGASEGMRIHDNLIERCCDNAVECENHAVDLRFFNNVVVDAFEPISWQPLNGTPWPGPIFIYGNIVYNTPENARLWEKFWPGRSWLKAGADPKNWDAHNTHMASVPKDAPAEPPLPGFLLYNNTVVFPGGNFLTTLGQKRVYRNFKVFNNLIAMTGEFNQRTPTYTAPDIEFARNAYVHMGRSVPVAGGAHLAGEGGRTVAGLSDLGLSGDGFPFAPLGASPLKGAGREMPGIKGCSRDVGAIPCGSTWAMPKVGPQPMEVEAP
jgi:hypothetical protein